MQSFIFDILKDEVIVATGVVKFYNVSKGYGFIVEDDTTQEVFLHVSKLADTTVKDGDKIEFDMELTQRGLVASNIKVTT